MERRKFVIGLGSLAAGGAAAAGTGAFDSVEADRGAEVNVAADNVAYLALSSDDDYVEDDSDEGELTIDLGGTTNSEDGEGFNEDAVTDISGVFEIENRGTQEVDVGFEDIDNPQDETDFEIEAGEDGAEVTFTIQDQTLGTGDSTDVDVVVDTTAEPDDPDETVDIDLVANEDNN